MEERLGLSGKDANLFTAKKIRSKTNKDLGFVGDIENVDETLIATLTGNGYIPVVSSIGVDKDNKSLNMNADHVAQCIATAVNAIKLIYLTDVQGLSIEGKLQSTLKLKKATLASLRYFSINSSKLPLTVILPSIKMLYS